MVQRHEHAAVRTRDATRTTSPAMCATRPACSSEIVVSASTTRIPGRSMTSTPWTRCRPCVASAGCGSTCRDRLTSWLPGHDGDVDVEPAEQLADGRPFLWRAVVREVALHDEQLCSPGERVGDRAPGAPDCVRHRAPRLLHAIEHPEEVAPDVEIVDRRDAARLARPGGGAIVRTGTSMSSASDVHRLLRGRPQSVDDARARIAVAVLPPGESGRCQARPRTPTGPRAVVSLVQSSAADNASRSRSRNATLTRSPLEVLRDGLRRPAAADARRRTRPRPARRPDR